jgi:hypothetical protein
MGMVSGAQSDDQQVNSERDDQKSGVQKSESHHAECTGMQQTDQKIVDDRFHSEKPPKQRKSICRLPEMVCVLRPLGQGRLWREWPRDDGIEKGVQARREK